MYIVTAIYSPILGLKIMIIFFLPVCEGVGGGGHDWPTAAVVAAAAVKIGVLITGGGRSRQVIQIRQTGKTRSWKREQNKQYRYFYKIIQQDL